MKQIVVVALAILGLTFFSGGAAVGQKLTAAAKAVARGNLKLEHAVADRYEKITPFLHAGAKTKLTAASVALIVILVKKPGPSDSANSSRAEVTKRFAKLTSAQSNLLTFYTIAEVARYAGSLFDGDAAKNELDSMSELGETESLRLQMAMDRVSSLRRHYRNAFLPNFGRDSGSS
jgi:hypothetical protein